jgi:tripartite-type tricarboxylate transporter receptor subunit TctC
MGLARREFLLAAAGAAALPVASRVAKAQAYPARPVRLIVATAAGGGNDITARLMGQALSERLGQPFVIENRPGAGGNLGTEAVVRAPADGYTLLLVSSGNATNAALYDKLTFDFMRDLAPVAGIMRVPEIMALNPSVPAKTVPEFIAYAKANPGKVNMDDVGRRDGSRSLSRDGACAPGPALRTGADRVRLDSIHDRVRQSRHALCVGSDDRNTLRDVARHSYGRRIRPRL